MASVTGAGKDSLGSEAGPLPHGLTPDVASGGQRLGLGIRVGLALEGHRGGVRPDAGALAAGLGGHLAGHRSGQRLGMGRIIAAGEHGGGGLRSGPGPGRLTPGVAGGRDGQSLQGGLVLAVGVAEQLPADGALPIRLGTGGFAGGGHLRYRGESMAVGAGIGGAVGHGHVVDGEHGVGILIDLVGLLIEVEGELGIVRAEGGGNGNMGRAVVPIAGNFAQIGGVPDGGPGPAAVGGGLHGHGAVTADDILEQQVIKVQRRRLAGQVHHRGDEVLILQLVAAAGHRQQGLADASHAPVAPGIFIVIHVDAGLLGGIELGIGALVPGIGAVGTGALHGPAVAGEGLGLEVVVELHVGGRLGEQGGDGVVGGDILKGVAVHRAHALAVHQHIGDGIALGGGDGEGLGRALLHGHLTGGGDGAALTGGGGDGVLLGYGAVLHRHQLHVVHRQGGGVVGGVHIAEGELDTVHRILGGNLDLSAARQGIAAGFLAGVAVLEVPDGGPGLAAVGGGLHGGGEGLVLDAVNAVGIVEIQNAIPGAGQVHGRGDQPLVLRAAVPVVGNVGVLGVVAQALPVVIGILLPGVAVGVDALEGPAVEGEAVAGDGLEVVLEHHGGDIGDLLKYGGNGVALVHGQGQDIAGNGGGAAVDLHGGQLIALVRGEGNVHGLAGDIGGLTGGGHGTAVGGGGGQGHGVAGSAAGDGELDVVHGQRTGFVSGIHIMEGELNAVHCILGRDSQLLASGNNAGLLAIVAVEEVPQSGPGLAAVSGYLHGGCVGLVLCSVVAVAIVEGQGCFLAGQIHRRGDQILVLRAAVPVIGDIGVLGVVDILPVPVGLLLPGVAVGVDTLQAPAVEGEALTGHRFKVVVEQHHVAGLLGLLEGGGDGVVHAHPLEGIVADGAQIRAVHGDVGNLIALGGGNGEGFAGALLHQGLTGGVNGAALTGGGGDGHIVVPLLGVQLNVVQRQVGAALAGVDKGEAQVLAVLQALGNVDLGLGLGPGGEQAGIPLQVPDLLPGGAAVAGGHDLEVAVLILHGVPIGGVEVKHHVDIGIHAADIGGAGDEPLVLLVVVVMIHGGHVVLVAVPGVQRAALALDAPVVGEPLLVEVLGPEDVGGRDGAVIVGVAGSADGIHLGVAGVVMDDHAEGLAEAGDVILADMAGDAGLQLAEALHAVQHLGIGHVVEHHGRHILVIGHVQAQVIPALGLGDLQVVGVGLLGVDGDGEGPGTLLIGPHAVAIGQGGLDGHGSLGVVGQLGVVGVGAVPGLDTGVIGVCAGGHDAVIVIAVDGLAHILAVLAVVHLAVGAGDGVFQALGIAQQTGVDTGEAVHKVIVVGRDGVAVCQIRHAGVVVVTQVGVHRVLAGGGEGGVHIGLGLAGGAVQSLPVIGGVHDGGLGPVAVEGQEGHAQINGIREAAAVCGHLGQGHEALHIAAVGELGQHRPALVGDGDGDGDIGGLAGSHGHAVILAVGGEGVGQQPGASADGGELLLIAVDVALGGVRQDDGGHVVIQGVTAGVVNGEGHGIHALHSGIVLQLQLGTLHARHGQITPGIHGVVDAHQAGALLAGRIGHAVVVIDHMGGAHEQGIGHVLAVRAGHRGIAGLQGLLDDGHAARHMGGGHGGAVHALIAAGHGGIDARAGGGELRLQGQLGGGAPAGEIGHAVGGRLHQGVGRSHGQGLGLLLLHVFAGSLGDKRAGNLPVGDGHIQHAGDVVVHQHTDGAGVGGSALLLLVVHTAAPLDQGDLALSIQALIVGLGAVVGHHHILQGAPGGQAAEGLGVLVVADGGAVLIGQVLAAHGDIGAVDHAVGHGGHGQGLAIGRGLADQAVIGVGGQGLAAEGVAIGGVIGVAGGHSQGHAALAGALEHVQQALGEGILAVIVDVAAVGAQAQVGHVHAQQDAVLQGGQNIGIGRAAAALEHVHVDDLGLGRHAHDGIVYAHITGGGGGHMGAVAALFAGIAVLILVAVVELEGDLGAVVQVGHADALDDALHLEIIGLQQGPELFLGQGGALGRGLEHLVAHVHAGIQNGHQHSLAGKAGGVIAAAADHLVAVGGVRQQLKRGGNEGGLDAVQPADGLVLAIGHRGGEAVEQGGVLPLGLHLGVKGAFDLGQGALLRAQQGVDLGPGIGVGHGVVYHHDDLDFIAVVELGGVFHLDSFAVLLAAAQDLAGDIVGDTIQRRLMERGVGLVRSRLGEGCHRQGGQDHQNRQGQCAAPFDSCHLVPPISVSRTPCIKVWRTLCIVPSFAVQRNNAMCANIPPKICGFREKSGSGHSLPPTAVRCSSFRKLKIFSRYSRQSGGTFPVFSLDNRSRDRI